MAKLPYLPVLQKSISSAVPRPVTPFYPAVTKAVQDNAYAAIQGQKSVDQSPGALNDALAGLLLVRLRVGHEGSPEVRARMIVL